MKKLTPRRPFGMERKNGKDWVVGPGTTWLWVNPTIFEAAICLNGAYADGFKAGVRAAIRREKKR